MSYTAYLNLIVLAGVVGVIGTAAIVLHYMIYDDARAKVSGCSIAGFLLNSVAFVMMVIGLFGVLL